MTALNEIERLIEQVSARVLTIEERVKKIESRIEAMEKTMAHLEQDDAQKALNREREIKTAIIRTIGGAVGGGLVFIAMKLASIF